MAPHDDRTCWLVKAGPKAKYARDFVTTGMVSIGSEWPGVGDLSEMSDSELFMKLEDIARKKPKDDLVQLRIFSNRMAEGDLVVTPDGKKGDVVFGWVVSEYGYTGTPVLGDHHHGRVADWFGRIASDQLEPFMVKALAWRGGSLRKLPEQTNWLRLAGELIDGRGRAATDFPRIPAAAKPKKRASSKARVAAKPEVMVNPDRVCNVCGLLRAESMFVDGGDYCRDCD